MYNLTDQEIEAHFERANLDPNDERAARALVEVLRDEQWFSSFVARLAYKSRLGQTTTEAVVTEAIEDMLKEARRGRIEKSPRAWLIGVARRKASARSEVLSRDRETGRPHVVESAQYDEGTVPGGGNDVADELAARDVRGEAFKKWRELIPRLGWDLAEEVWLEIIRQLEAGGPVMDLRSVAEAVGRKFAAVKTAYYQGGERLGRLAVEHGVIDPSALAAELVIVDDDNEEDDNDG